MTEEVDEELSVAELYGAGLEYTGRVEEDQAVEEEVDT